MYLIDGVRTSEKSFTRKCSTRDLLTHVASSTILLIGRTCAVNLIERLFAFHPQPSRHRFA